MTTRKTKLLQNLALLLFGTFIGFVFSELLLRNTLNIYECDAELGWTYSPDMKGFKMSRTGEYFNAVQFNSLGLRDQEYQAGDGSNQRILFLGDSFVAGLQVEDEEHFTFLIEENLNSSERDDQDVEVLNAGIDGYGSAQQLLMFRRVSQLYKPDLTILAVFLYTDLSDNSIKTGHQNHHLASKCGRPYFEMGENGIQQVSEVNTKTSDNPRIIDTLFGWSFIYQVLFPPEYVEPAFYQQDLFRKEFPVLMNESWELTKEVLLDFASEVEESGSEFAVLIIPHGVQVGQISDTLNPADHPREKIDRSLILLSEFLESHNVPYINLGPPMRHHVETKEKLYLEKDGHWNKEGHVVVADIIIDWLENECSASLMLDANCESTEFTNH